MDAGYTDFFSGMAEGTDAWAALAVLALKKENPALRLHCLLPHEGQADKWSDSARERKATPKGRVQLNAKAVSLGLGEAQQVTSDIQKDIAGHYLSVPVVISIFTLV